MTGTPVSIERFLESLCQRLIDEALVHPARWCPLRLANQPTVQTENGGLPLLRARCPNPR